MPAYQLQIAIALEAAVAVSAVALFLNRTKEGKIQLPVHDHRDGEHEQENEVYPDGDPFDVTTPEDLVEGYPIEEEAFWAKMRRRKMFLSLLTSALVPLQIASLLLGGEPTVHALNLCYASYLSALSLASVARSRQRIGAHREAVWHLTILTLLAVVLMGFTAILPTQTETEVAETETVRRLAGLWYASLALAALASVTAMTTPCGPKLSYPPARIYSEKVAQAITNTDPHNVSGVNSASPLSFLYFEYTTKVAMLGTSAASLEIGDLPILTTTMRATHNYALMKRVMLSTPFSFYSWRPKAGSGFQTAAHLLRANASGLSTLGALSVGAAGLFYLPPFFMSRVLKYLEADVGRENRAWGLVWVGGLFGANVVLSVVTGQLWSLTTTTLQANIRTQLNSALFAKTLVRKDVASSAAAVGADNPKDGDAKKDDGGKEEEEDEDAFSSKAQVMTLMTTDVDRVGRFCHQMFTLIDAPLELAIGTTFLYSLLGTSAFVGLGVSVLCMPLNHFAGKVVKGAQTNLMKSRDERVALMNEVLGGIRMLKFMAWERSFEARIMKIRAVELRYQRLTFIIATLLEGLWDMAPILVTLVAFYHFAVIRGERLTPSIAFTSILVFNELKFALGALPELFVNIVQSIVSLQRIEKYLQMPEVNPVQPLRTQSHEIAFHSCTVTWPQRQRLISGTNTPAGTPRPNFVLVDVSLRFPPGELSLICGKLGSGKTLLLLALLGEADILSGGIVCPRSPADALASLAAARAPAPGTEDWVVKGMCAYVPQAAWLQNASIKDNILFNLPYDERRYRLTLEVCALVSDLAILEDGDESEIGERGVNLSGGQKARVSLARAVYSRASVLLLDDVLSAVDAHTAHHLYHSCLRGELMQGRTVILVSHHVQLCAPGAAYVVALDNGRVQFQGTRDAFQASGVMRGLMQSSTTAPEAQDAAEEAAVELPLSSKDQNVTAVAVVEADKEKKQPRKFSEDEQRMVGRVAWSVWKAYILGTGSPWYWALFLFVFIVAALAPILENGWLSYWSRGDDVNSPLFYLSVYAAVSILGLILSTVRYFVLYQGAIHASTVLYKDLLQAVLFAKIRLHDTISRGRLLNRFGKDFEVIDSSLPGNFGRSFMYLMATLTTVVTISFVGGPAFVFAAFLISIAYYQVASIYGRACRDMRRLESVTRSPLYSMYSETIAGVTIVRAFGASSKFLRDMLRHVDTNTNPGYWNWGINRWLSIRMIGLASIATSLLATLAVMNKDISAPLAGFALAFSNTITYDLLLLIREFVSLEQAMVGLERVKEYTELAQEPPEFIEPRPAPSWPEHGAIHCEDLVVKYAPELPDVLHKLSFDVKPGEKVGILGRTGSGKSTLALCFFRFVEPVGGKIVVDGLDIAHIGLTDLRSRLTIIPQDPTILSGTLRTTLDVFNEYQDADLFEALRRVHLIPSEDTPEEIEGTVNANLFRNLDSAVSEGGDNFSTGEKQLLCMARAILKRSKILVMDEATASVDYNTDELIGKTIRHEFKDSTILTIAHRLRTVIDYDRIMLLDQGEIAEFDRPAVLLADKSSKFYSLCKATGKEEFAMLQKMAGV